MPGLVGQMIAGGEHGGPEHSLQPAGAYDHVVILDILGALAPPVGVGFLFFLVVRALIHADRRERDAMARQLAEEMRSRSGGDRPATP